LAGLVVSVDRMERGTGAKSALGQVAEEFDMPTFAIVTIEEVMEHLRGREIDGRVPMNDAMHARVAAYLDEYRP